MRKNRDGGDDGGKEVYGVFGKKIQPQVTQLSTSSSIKRIEECAWCSYNLDIIWTDT